MKRVYLETFGCQMNQLDSQLVQGRLMEAGYESCDAPEQADLILFNTCSVRRHAEKKVLSRLGMLKALKEQRSGLIIGVMGCMAQACADEIRRTAPHVDLIIGTRQLGNVLEAIEETRSTGRPAVRLSEDGDLSDLLAGPHPRSSRFSAYVSVMRGCDNFCSYCIVPYVRGREFSRPMDEIVDEVRRLVDEGVIEVTLLGQNINSYGKGVPEASLARLLERLGGIEGLRWIRFITSHPRDMTDELLTTMAEVEAVIEYLHLPAQSGSNSILKAMNRGYTRAHYLGILERACRLMPELVIAGDFIVGFPGETERDFEESVSLMETVRYTNCFIFKYSARPGTTAASLPDDVSVPVKKERNRRLLELQERISTEDNARRVGRTYDVLVEGPSKRNSSHYSGRTRGNQICIIGQRPDLVGRIVPVRITRTTALALYGDVVESVSAGASE